MRNLTNLTEAEMNEALSSAPECNETATTTATAERIELYGSFSAATAEVQDALSLQWSFNPGVTKQHVSMLKIEKEAVKYFNHLIETTYDLEAAYVLEATYDTRETFIGTWGGEHLVSIENISVDCGLEANTLRNSLPCVSGGRGEVVPTKEADRIYKLTRKIVKNIFLIGFVGHFPALAAINRRAYSGRGDNSPATGTFVHDYIAFDFMNIHKMEKMIWAVKEAAMRKHGIKVSYENALAAASIAGVAVSKAATVAFALSLGFYVGSYREAREQIIDYLTAKAVDDIRVINGVESFGHKEVLRKGKITAYSCYYKTICERRQRIVDGYLYLHEIEGSYHTQIKRSSTAVKEAIKAFKERKAMRIANLELEAKVAAEAGVLVRVEDSYNAGNCVAGTNEWLCKVGLNGQKLVPLYRVYKAALKSSEPLAMNVVKKVVAEVTVA